MTEQNQPIEDAVFTEIPPETDIDLGITDEQREASKEMYEAMMKQQYLSQYGPIFETINSLFLHEEEQGKIHNLIRGAEERWRCIVHNGKEIKPTKVEEGASISYQVFEPENGDEIMWVYYHPEHRMIIRQTGYDVENNFELLTGDEIGTIYTGDNLGYFAGFLSDMGCLNNVLLDPNVVERFEKAKVIVDTLIGNSNESVKSFLVNNLSVANDLSKLPTNWEEAKPLEGVENLEYGISVVANATEVTDYSNTLLFYWMTPPMVDTEGNPVIAEGEEANMTVLRTGMLREENLPPPEANSVSNFKVRLNVDDSWKAVLIFTQSGFGEHGFVHFELLAREGFNPVISKNI